MSENGHANIIKSPRMSAYILVMLLSLAIVVPCLVCRSFGIAPYIIGRLNLERVIIKGAIVAVILGLLTLISVVVLAVAAFLYWRGGAPRARRNTLLLAAILAAFVASQMLPHSPETMFLRGLRQHMQRKADIAAIRDWLGTLNPDDVGASGTYSNHVSINPPDRPECISRVRPRMVVVSKVDTGRLSVCLSWGDRMVGRWGLVVRREETAVDLLADPSDPRTYKLPIAPGAYVYRTRPYWATP
jgi:hypothetical protein